MIGQHIPRAMEHSRSMIQGLSESLYCRFLDRVSVTDLPSFMMVPLLRAYSRVYHVDADDLATPFDGYSNLREFFTRQLRSGARHIDTDPSRVTSPVDGQVLTAGMFQEQPLQTVSIKGRLYTIEDLLGADAIPAGFRSGAYVLFYLAPGDYHRFHSPMDGTITQWDYLPGTCRPVNRLGRRLFPDVYVTNRRVVLWLRGGDDPALDACLVFIGAMGVGRIVIETDGLRIDGDGQQERHVKLDEPIPVSRGEELGRFELGSSALLICSADAYRTTILADDGPIRLGMPVLGISPREGTDG